MAVYELCEKHVDISSALAYMDEPNTVATREKADAHPHPCSDDPVDEDAQLRLCK